MVTFDRVAPMGEAADGFRREGRRIALVPTMGALHEGHLSLIRIARTHADVVVVSVFVNPAQFGKGEDFERYPRDLARDSSLAAGAGADVLFAPDAAGMYPDGHAAGVDPGPIAGVLEGKSRPGHFRGVATVVAKLFNITRPHVAVFGRKDAQQLAVIRRIAADLDFNIEIVGAPTVREADGLAMSSRNAYLSAAERAQAPVLRRSLDAAMQAAAAGERDCTRLLSLMRGIIAARPAAEIDYVSIADAGTLEELPRLTPAKPALVSLAVKFGATRLIDNDTIIVE